MSKSTGSRCVEVDSSFMTKIPLLLPIWFERRYVGYRLLLLIVDIFCVVHEKYLSHIKAIGFMVQAVQMLVGQSELRGE